MPRLFVKNRALGYVSNHVPLCVRYIRRRKQNFVITCVGNAFHTYNCGNLALLSVSGCHPADIQVLCGDAFLVYTACGNEIFAWKRGFELKHVYRGHLSPVQLMLPFGEHLISVDEESNLIVWIIKTQDIYLELNFQENQFSISAMLHPSTYTNKVLLGSDKGELQLWNLHTSKLIYSFKGWGSSVLVLEQSPAVDVVAIGLASGQIILHNLRYDETVVNFSQDWGPVTSLSFRTDGPPFMISGSSAGHIVIWDLEKRRVASQLREAHAGAVTGLQCLPNEPVFVTSSPDNSLKTWIFDQPNDLARQLCAKEGHHLPPSIVRFHKADGKNIISSGGDASLRVFSTVTERFNKSMGRATYNRKAMKKGTVSVKSVMMPPVSMFAAESTRGKHWDDIICGHVGLNMVTTWSFEKFCMGSHKLVPHSTTGKDKGMVVSTLCLTHCGNYAIIGYSTGQIHRFNMQSGSHRGMYGSLTAHDSPVRGVAVDNLNKLVVSGDAIGIVKFWNFNPKLSTSPVYKLTLSEGISYFRSHDEASLLAVIMEDFSLCIIDQDTRSVVRKLDGHPNRITDAAFSPDARWLVTAGMDCLICVWDIPSGKPVELFRLDRACTSLSFSPNGQYLATTHVDLLGIYLWSNRALYTHVTLHPCPTPLEVASTLEELPLVELPGAVGESGLPHGEDEHGSDFDDEDGEPQYVSPEQLATDMISFSSLSTSRWQNLLNIDIIRRKNKPKKPPEAPKSAPFFLPTIPSLDFQFDIKPDENDNAESSKKNHLYSMTAFGNLLLKTIDDNDFSAVLEKLKSLGPTSIDYEIGCLSPENGGSLVLMLQFLKLIDHMFQSKKDYELAQAYLGLFLKVHGRTIAGDSNLIELSRKLSETQEECWNALQEKIFFCLSVVQSLKTL